MSNGLGAGFFGLTVLVVLLGIAALLILCLAGVFAYRRRKRAVPRWPRYVASCGLTGVIVVAGFAVVVLYPEAATLARLLMSVVMIPIVAGSVYLQHRVELNRLQLASSVGMAWSLPFVLGVIVTFGLANGITTAFDLATVEARALGLYWVASALGGAVVVIGTIWLGTRLSSWKQ